MALFTPVFSSSSGLWPFKGGPNPRARKVRNCDGVVMSYNTTYIMYIAIQVGWGPVNPVAVYYTIICLMHWSNGASSATMVPSILSMCEHLQLSLIGSGCTLHSVVLAICSVVDVITPLRLYV